MDKESYFNQLKKSVEPEALKVEEKTVEGEGGIKSIRTFKNDVADAVKKNNISYTKVAMQEAERNRKLEGLVVAPKTHTVKNTLLFVSTIFFIGLSAAIGYGVYSYFQLHKNDQTTVVTQPEIIPGDLEKILSLKTSDRTSIVAALQNERKNILAPSAVENIKLQLVTATGSTTPINAQDIFSIFGSNIPGTTLRTIQNQYTMGLYGNGKTNTTFIVLKIDSYEDAYGGMIEWEKFIKDDLKNFLVIPFTKTSISSVTVKTPTGTSTATSGVKVASTTVIATTTASSTIVTSTTVIPINNTFQDEVIANKDVRILKDIEGNTLFLYSFLDKQTLVLATNGDALIEIQKRLLSLQRVQ